MDEQLQNGIRKAVDLYSGHFYWRSCKKQESLGFWDFVKSLKGRHALFRKELSNFAIKNGYLESELILQAMTEKQKHDLGGKFFDSFDEEFSSYKREENEGIEKIVLSSPELQEFRKTIQPYLDKDSNIRILAKFAKTLYEQMTDEQKKDYSEKKVFFTILNIGFLRIPRVSHRAACDFIVKYPALFRDEQEVVDSMVERFVDEELSSTPINQTKNKTGELRDYVRNLYGATK